MIGATLSPSVSAPELVVEWRRGRALVARWGSVVFVRWTGVPTSAQLGALAAAHARAATLGPVALVNAISAMEGRPVVEPEIHAAIVGLIRTCRGRTRAVAHLVELGGPVGLAVRAFLGSLERIAESPSTKVASFDRIEPLARWLATGPTRIDAAALLDAWRAMERSPSAQLAA
ncbi:MAG: hypothetical protein U0234_14090 [Sandaracinus sp.]